MAAPTFLIARANVEVQEGAEGFIGSGALGEVRRGRYQGKPCALKGLHLLRTDAASVAAFGGALNPDERKAFLSKFIQECRLLQSFEHENIVPFFGVVCDDTPAREPLYLAMEFIPSGTVQDLVHAERYRTMRTDDRCLPLETQLVVLSGLFAALEYLAGRHLIHRDVKPANILAVVESERLEKILLADFGEAKQLTRSMSRVSGAGTPVYMAPEMGEADEAKGPKADVFSAGVVAVEMSSGKSPNPGPALRKQGRTRVAVPEEDRRASDIAAVRHEQIKAIARRCIIDDDEQRAPAAEMRQQCDEMLTAFRAARAAQQAEEAEAARAAAAEAAAARAAAEQAAEQARQTALVAQAEDEKAEVGTDSTLSKKQLKRARQKAKAAASKAAEGSVLEPEPEPDPEPDLEPEPKPEPASDPEPAPESAAASTEATKAQQEKRKKKERQARRKAARAAIVRLETAGSPEAVFDAVLNLLNGSCEDEHALAACMRILNGCHDRHASLLAESCHDGCSDPEKAAALIDALRHAFVQGCTCSIPEFFGDKRVGVGEAGGYPFLLKAYMVGLDLLPCTEKGDIAATVELCRVLALEEDLLVEFASLPNFSGHGNTYVAGQTPLPVAGLYNGRVPAVVVATSFKPTRRIEQALSRFERARPQTLDNGEQALAESDFEELIQNLEYMTEAVGPGTRYLERGSIIGCSLGAAGAALLLVKIMAMTVGVAGTPFANYLSTQPTTARIGASTGTIEVSRSISSTSLPVSFGLTVLHKR